MNDTTDFWQKHSIEFLEMAFRGDRRERVHDPDARGRNTGDCGDSVEIFLMVEEDRIRSVSYDLDGCINTNACANALAEMVEGRSMPDAWEIAPEDVIGYLKTLPMESYHCAELAVGALHRALSDYRNRRQAHQVG